MARKKQHEIFSKTQTLEMVPCISREHLRAGVGFKDAQVDDARLVLRLIFDGCNMGGQALNYTKVNGIERNDRGDVAAVNLTDTEHGHTVQVKTPVVINATGASAEKLHPSPMRGFHIRPLRGSHLVFPGELFPLDRVISFLHPRDKRPVFLFPWEGALFLGTTDVDHSGDLLREPCITMDEADYLMTGLTGILPHLKISPDDCIASIAGVRPVLSKKKVAASKESREHVVWKNRGLVTVTGGKLTTFRLLAMDALKAAEKYLPRPSEKGPGAASGSSSGLSTYELSPKTTLRLLGRYGTRVPDMAAICGKETFSPIATTQTLWAELCHGARHEQIRHLSDLLLRRVRIGLLLPRGGMDLMDEIESRIKPFLSWDEAKWIREKKAYERLWIHAYAPPGLKWSGTKRKPVLVHGGETPREFQTLAP